MAYSVEQTLQYVAVGLLLFNGIKAILVSVVTFVIYKKVSLEIFKVDSGFSRKKKLSNS